MKKLFKFLLAAVMAVGLCGCKGEEKSDKLVVYTPNSASLINAVEPAFEAKYGIDVEFITMGTGDCLTRINSEKENPQADVQWGGMNRANYDKDPSLWESYVSKNDKNLHEDYQNYKGAVSHYALDGSGALLLNLDKLKELGVDPDEIKGYDDLLNPKLKGWIAMGKPEKSSSAWAELTNMLLVMGDKPYDDKAWEWVGKFIENLDGKTIDSSGAIYKGTSAGEYAVGVSYEDPCISLLVSGAKNVKLVYPEEGAVWLPAGMAIVKNAPNLENAKLFVDFVQSEDGQKAVAESTARPVITSIANTAEEIIPFSEINLAYEDVELCAAKKSEWQQKWLDLLQK
jgi:iron(III) transport system substrate-binding protein